MVTNLSSIHEDVGSIPGLAQPELWRRLAATDPFRPLAWELPYASGVTLKRPKQTKKLNEITKTKYSDIPGLRTWPSHCCGNHGCYGSSWIPGLATFACHRCSKKLKKKKKKKKKTGPQIWFSAGSYQWPTPTRRRSWDKEPSFGLDNNCPYYCTTFIGMNRLGQDRTFFFCWSIFFFKSYHIMLFASLPSLGFMNFT